MGAMTNYGPIQKINSLYEFYWHKTFTREIL